MFRTKRSWPELPHEEIVRRARILVIDDHDFPYKKLFERDGYTVEKWVRVRELTDLEDGRFDLILLDLLGVGEKESADQGLGILKHIRTAAPAQLVIAYSNADWPLSSQPFFNMADAVLPKTADYVEFKRVVDELLDRRFSLGFYVGRIEEVVGDAVPSASVLRSKVQAAILSGRPDRLRKYLMRNVDDPAIVDRAINLTSLAVGLLSLWKN